MRIDWGTGYMDVHEHIYFPAAQDRARKLFRLIKDHCTDAEKAAWHEHLRNTAEYFRYYNEGGVLDVSDSWVAGMPRFYYTPSECKTLYKRAVGNLKMFEKMCGKYNDCDFSGGDAI